MTAADVKDLVGARGLEVVRTADRVEFFKLRIDQYGAEPPEIDRQLSGTPAQLSHARDELLAADIYSYTQRGGHKRCGGFQPRDAVRFWRGKESVVFLICFTCADVAVVTHDADGDASPFIIADVQPGRSRLRDLMEGVFPGTVPAAH